MSRLGTLFNVFCDFRAMTGGVDAFGTFEHPSLLVCYVMLVKFGDSSHEQVAVRTLVHVAFDLLGIQQIVLTNCK